MHSMSRNKSPNATHDLNLNQIIEQTERLHNGTLKI